MSEIVYPRCRACGEMHEMGIVDEKGTLEPFIICPNCIVPLIYTPMPGDEEPPKVDYNKFRMRIEENLK